MSNRAGVHGRARTTVVAVIASLSFVGLMSCTPQVPDERPSAAVRESTAQTPTASPTPTPTPSATTPGLLAALPDGVKPTRPAAFDGPPSVESAQAVLAYWLQLLPYAQQAGDTSEAKALSHPECVFCDSMTSAIDELLARGERSVGGGYTISNVAGSEVSLGHWYALKLTLVEAPSTEVDEFARTVNSYSGHTYAVDAVVLHEAGSWTIRELSYEVTA